MESVGKTLAQLSDILRCLCRRQIDSAGHPRHVKAFSNNRIQVEQWVLMESPCFPNSTSGAVAVNRFPECFPNDETDEESLVLLSVEAVSKIQYLSSQKNRVVKQALEIALSPKNPGFRETVLS